MQLDIMNVARNDQQYVAMVTSQLAEVIGKPGDPAPDPQWLTKPFSQSRLALSSQASLPLCQPVSSEFWLPLQSPERRM